MGTSGPRGNMLRATLCEIERGLFHISYRTDTQQLQTHHQLPPYEVGTCASDAQQRIEQHALGCGYQGIIWDSVVVPDLMSACKTQSTQADRP